jgi:hypothetical protein
MRRHLSVSAFLLVLVLTGCAGFIFPNPPRHGSKWYEELQPGEETDPADEQPPQKQSKRWVDKRPLRRIPAQFVMGCSAGWLCFTNFRPAGLDEHMHVRSDRGFVSEYENFFLFPRETRVRESMQLTRFGLGFRLKYLFPVLSRDQFDCGTLEILGGMLQFRLMQMPGEHGLVGCHCEVGIGLGYTEFSRDSDYDRYRFLLGQPPARIRTGIAEFCSFGFGVDFHSRDRKWCVTWGIRFEYVRVPTEWNDFYCFRDRIDWLALQHFQFTLGLYFFF